VHEDAPLAAYSAIDVTTLILCGTQSPKPSRAISRLLADTLPCVKHRTIRNAGHMSPITHPAEVNPVILEHLLINGAGDDERRPLPSSSHPATRTPSPAHAGPL
jgi:pimeloyl-ACP methyl ester carboxylesterase